MSIRRPVNLTTASEDQLPAVVCVTDSALCEYEIGDYVLPMQCEMRGKGLSVELLLAIARDRLRLLDAQLASLHNQVAMDSITDALEALKARTRDRKRRGVEGTKDP